MRTFAGKTAMNLGESGLDWPIRFHLSRAKLYWTLLSGVHFDLRKKYGGDILRYILLNFSHTQTYLIVLRGSRKKRKRVSILWVNWRWLPPSGSNRVMPR